MTEFDLYADENKPEANLFSMVYRVELPRDLRVRFKAGELPFVYVAVDNYGMTSIEPPTLWFGESFDNLTYERKQEVYEWLIEWEFAEWLKVGPEDRELFATEKLVGKEEYAKIEAERAY